jgi:UDP-2,3-diacylglucosamine pyrophosphatase LpxH
VVEHGAGLRAVFISDLHLGARECLAAVLAAGLRKAA